jgi:hypothetical protein
MLIFGINRSGCLIQNYYRSIFYKHKYTGQTRPRH